MTLDEARAALVTLMVEKSDAAIVAAHRDLDAGDTSLAMNRIYYACFYAAGAVLLRDGRQFVKHKGLKSAVHQYLVNTGRMSAELGTFYDQAFLNRMAADYDVRSTFSRESCTEALAGAERFVAEMKRLLTRQDPETRASG